MSKHGRELSTKFDKEETARRERLGKMTEAPQPAAQQPATEATETERFNISNGDRA
jgi:hypothetical protein